MQLGLSSTAPAARAAGGRSATAAAVPQSGPSLLQQQLHRAAQCPTHCRQQQQERGRVAVCAAAAAVPGDEQDVNEQRSASDLQQQEQQQQHYDNLHYQHHHHHQQQQQQQNHGWQQLLRQQNRQQQQQRLRQQQLPLAHAQPRQQQQQLPALMAQQRRQPQQQQQQQQQQRRRTASMLLDAQQQHHASVLANAWGESDRRAALAALVKSADSVDSLAAVWLTCRSSAGAAELAVLFNRLANVCQPKVMSVKGISTAKVLLRELLIASEDKMSSMAGPEFVYIIASLAKLRAAPDNAWINRWLAMSRHRLGRLNPQQMVMCVRALGRLDVKTIDIHGCIAFPAWMHNYTASLAPHLPELSGFELVKLVLGFSMLGYKPAWGFLNQVAAAVEPKLSGLDTVHLTCLLSSWSILKYEPEPLVMRRVMGEVYTKLPLFDDKDLTTALTSFCSMRRMLRKDVLDDFVAQVSTKMATFSPRELAGVLVALGHLGYNPGPVWLTQACECFRGKLQMSRKGSTFALIAQGLLKCGCDPEPWLVNELIDASSPKVPRMDIGDLQTLAHAISKFSYRPEPGSAAFKSWQRWFERLAHVVGRHSLLTKQAMVLLEAMCDAGMPPDPKTTDHLVLQMVSNGLNKAPVALIARLLDVLRVCQQQQAGGQFLNHYANTLKLVVTQLSSDHIAAALRALALEGFVPQDWWVVCMLAAVHTRCDEFGGPAAAELLWGVARLCQSCQLPSDKWVKDFGGRFWAAVSEVGAGRSSSSPAGAAAGGGEALRQSAAVQRGGNGRANRYMQQAPGHPWAGQAAAAGQPDRTLTAQQLGLGLWGAVTMGFRPSAEQWAQWEAAAKTLGWGFPLDAVQAAVLGYKTAGRALPRELSQQLQAEKAKAEEDAQRQVEAAAAEKAAAAHQLAMQQERMRQAAAAVQAFQLQQQQVMGSEPAVASR